MSMIQSKNALPASGAIYITINFKVVEINDRSYTSDGHSAFVNNVRKVRRKLLMNAIYNAVKREFPNRTVTPYNILIIEYHYTYYLEEYENVQIKGVYYEKFRDVEAKRTRYYKKDAYELKDNYVEQYEAD